MNFFSDTLCKKLQLSTRSDTLAISGIVDNLEKLVKGAATLELMSQYDAKVRLKLLAYVLHIISQYEQRIHKLCTAWSHLQGLPIADNFEFPPNEIDILLGTDVYPYILLDGFKSRARQVHRSLNTPFSDGHSLGLYPWDRQSQHQSCYLVTLL